MRKNIRLVRDESRSPEMRANASALLGIFSAYRRVTHDALILHGGASEELTQCFLDLTENLYFQKLSEEMHLLGFMKTAVNQIPKINRTVRMAFRHASIKKIVDLGSKAVTVATRAPLPDSSLAESLLPDRYLPPIVDLRSAIIKARKSLVKHGNIDGLLGLDPNTRHHKFSGIGCARTADQDRVSKYSPS